jgi:hypothetical protein
MSSVVFYAEYSSATASIQLVLGQHERTRVKFLDQAIVLTDEPPPGEHQHPQTRIELPQPLDMSQSFSPLLADGALHFRLQCVYDEHGASMARPFFAAQDALQKTLVKQLQTARGIRCGACAQPFVPESGKPIFSRVLPLPSDSWYELNETLSCHASHIAKERLAPGRDVCLVGADHFVVAAANIVIGSITQHPSALRPAVGAG